MSTRTSKRSSSANGNGGGKWITSVRRLSIYLRDSFGCLLCGGDMHDADPFDVSLDHVKCRRRGEAANHKSGNLISAHRSCNSRRHDLTLRAFFEKEAEKRFPDNDDRPMRTWYVEMRLLKIRRATRRKMDKYTALAKSLIEERSVARAQEVRNE